MKIIDIGYNSASFGGNSLCNYVNNDYILLFALDV